jgi:hypothetical protein
MKNSIILLVATLLVPSAFAQAPDLKTEKDKVVTASAGHWNYH